MKRLYGQSSNGASHAGDMVVDKGEIKEGATESTTECCERPSSKKQYIGFCRKFDQILII